MPRISATSKEVFAANLAHSTEKGIYRDSVDLFGLQLETVFSSLVVIKSFGFTLYGQMQSNCR